MIVTLVNDPYLRPQFPVKDGPVPVNRFSPDKRKRMQTKTK